MVPLYMIGSEITENKIQRMGKKQRSEEEGYGNDSRPWLLGLRPEEPFMTSSTTKDTFTGDRPSAPSGEGIRKQMLKKELWDQAKKQILEELSKPDTNEQPTTTYSGTFVKEGFKAEPIKTAPELHQKYPLYLDQGVSVWREKLPSLPGATRSPHPRHQFRRYAGFTTPIDKLLYDPADIH
ncbi:sperm-associated antigen 8-like isoform X1 [Macrosteles quadrilineatus]|uniref:sperm-associated antigen 8-like isoform X1 n=2 Tax=Macrosteles quadrilineatus TaxID=74068 RepID=UPI0023E10759|nr:sperm-associated antigen 8-like isoform X1 [Macrosteles quadrilineatus]